LSKAIAFKINGKSFLAETDDLVSVPAHVSAVVTNPQVDVPEGVREVVDIARAKHDFDEVQDLIVNCSIGLLEAIKNIPEPDKVAVEFGIKLAGEGGIPMLTKITGEATFKVSIEWKKE
jgi:hypothetical protein